MTITQILTTAATYCGKTLADLTVSDQNLGLVALNQARTQAELLNDFEFNRQLVTLPVDGVTGGSLDAITIGEVAVDVKSVIEVGLFDTDGNLRPVEWTTVAESLERERSRKPGLYPRYRTDADVPSVCGAQRFTFSGRRVYLWPKTNGAQVELGLEVYVMTPDWLDEDLDSSFAPWTTKGSQYLLWQTIIQLNHLFKEFVFRQEGNLPPPKELADAGLEALKAWDIAQYETYRRHGR